MPMGQNKGLTQDRSVLIQNCDFYDEGVNRLVRTNLRMLGGRIAEIEQRLTPQPGEEVIHARGMVCLPAFVDAHTHLVQSLQKGQLDDLNITDWLVGMLGTQAKLTDEDWYYGVTLGLMQGLRFGTTTFNEMTYFPHVDAVVQAYRDAGMRVTFGLGATDIAENQETPANDIDTALKQAESIYQRYHEGDRGLLKTSVAPQGLPACTKELMQELKSFARERDLVFHTHLAEGKSETQSVRERTGYGEAEALHRYGVLDEKTVLAHSIWLADEELGLIKESGARVVHCPNTNMKLADGIAPIHKMLERGIPVALGCDGEASSSNRDMIREARAGSYLQKVASLNPQAMDVNTSFRMMTKWGAEALGYPDLGELKIGSRADLILVDMEDLSLIGEETKLGNLLYAGDGNRVDTVFCEGRLLLRNREFVHLDQERIAANVREIQNRLYK